MLGPSATRERGRGKSGEENKNKKTRNQFRRKSPAESIAFSSPLDFLIEFRFFFSQCIRPEKCLLAFQVGRFRRHGRPNCFVCFVLFFCCFLLYLGSPKIRFLLKWRMARDRLLFATERLPRLGGADQRKTTANICLRRFRVATFGLGLKKKTKNKKQITIIIDMIEYD